VGGGKGGPDKLGSGAVAGAADVVGAGSGGVATDANSVAMGTAACTGVTTSERGGAAALSSFAGALGPQAPSATAINVQGYHRLMRRAH
jgi:hypothetical protein